MAPHLKLYEFLCLFHKLTLWSDDVLEDVLANVRVDGGERVVQEVDCGVVVDGPSNTEIEKKLCNPVILNQTPGLPVFVSYL